MQGAWQLTESQKQMDVSHSRAPATRLELTLYRLRAQSGLLAGIAGVFVAMALFGGLSLVGALIGLAAVVAVIALLPDNAAAVAKPSALGTLVPDIAAGSRVSMFADALIDPCLVLDRRSVVLHANPAARRQYPGVTKGNPITFSMRNPDLV